VGSGRVHGDHQCGEGGEPPRSGPE
jgi:hypothetical protein